MPSRILVAKEKHSTRYLEASTDEQLEASARKLILERIALGYWYEGALLEKAPEAASEMYKKRASRFILEQDGEYEEVSLCNVEMP